jgi:hypothetical protein
MAWSHSTKPLRYGPDLSSVRTFLKEAEYAACNIYHSNGGSRPDYLG